MQDPHPFSPTRVARFWSKVQKTDGCWLWQAGVHSSYGQFSIAGRAVGVHRYAYELTYGPIPPGLNVCHHCDTPLCVRPTHLFLGTVADNMRDRDKKGRNGHQGKPNAQRKLSPAQAQAVRAQYIPHVTSYAILARQFGVSPACIQKICEGRCYRTSSPSDPIIPDWAYQEGQSGAL